MWDHFFLPPKGVRGQKTILKKALFAIGKGQTRSVMIDNAARYAEMALSIITHLVWPLQIAKCAFFKIILGGRKISYLYEINSKWLSNWQLKLM